MKWYQWLSWKLLKYTFCINLKKKYHIKCITHRDRPNSQFLLISNHSHITDPFIIGSYESTPVSYLANYEKASLLKRIFSFAVRIIPKKKAVIDPKAIKITFSRLKQGENIGLFPEGDRSWDGETNKIYDNTIKFIRKLNIPIRMVKLRGNYLSFPRWAKSKRRGTIFVELSAIMKDELDAMTDEELQKAINNFLYTNDVKDPELQKVSFKGKNLAEGIEFLLWLCPACGKHDTINGEGDIIVCKSCGEKWIVDGNQRIEPKNKAGNDLKDWFDWQKTKIKEIIQNSDKESILTKTNNVDIYLPRNYTYELYSKGELILYKDKMEFQSSNKEKEKLIFETENILFYADNFNKDFEFNYHKDRIRILFNGKNSNKWIYFFKALQNID
jgi:1-acyl-sn-glycerol-3-phosphate acyltransferase